MFNNNKANMATNKEKEKLVEILKFTPRTYKLTIWGYGAEHTFGHMPNQSSIAYMRKHDLNWEDVLCMSPDEWNVAGHEFTDHPCVSDGDGEYFHDVRDIDNLAHCWGAEHGISSHIFIQDENMQEVFETDTDSDSLEKHGIKFNVDLDVDIDNVETATTWLEKGRYLVDTRSIEKGTFYEADIELTDLFDIKKLSLYATRINEWPSVIDLVEYDGKQLDNYGGDTYNKGLDSKIYNLDEWV